MTVTSLATAAALLASACGGGTHIPNTTPDPEYSEVCVDERNHRVDDDRCPEPGYSSSSGYHHVYVPHAQPVLAVGHPVTGGVKTRPAGATAVKVPTGGFGGRGGTTCG